MRITICGSIAFLDEMLETKKNLEELGHEVKMPPTELIDEQGKAMPMKQYYAIRKQASDDMEWVWDKKGEAIKNHFDKIIWSDAALILNYDKNDIDNYIGPNTFLEIGLAFHAKKKIFLLNPMPEVIYKEEMLGMKPTIINGDYSLLV
jgi:hypothetical protein